MKQKKHIEERIELYLKDELTHNEIEELWVDILRQPEFLDDLKINIALKEYYKTQENQHSNAPVKGKHWLMATAAVMLAAVFTFFFLYTSPNIIDPVTHIDLHEIEAPAVMRSDQGAFTNGDSLLHEAFNAAVMDDTNKALSLYNEIINSSELEAYHAKAYLNQGIIYYNQARFEQAASSFQAAVDKTEEGAIEEKSQWYLGNTYVNLNALKDARASISRVYEIDGRYRSEAARMLLSLDSILK